MDTADKQKPLAQELLDILLPSRLLSWGKPVEGGTGLSPSWTWMDSCALEMAGLEPGAWQAASWASRHLVSHSQADIEQ